MWRNLLSQVLHSPKHNVLILTSVRGCMVNWSGVTSYWITFSTHLLFHGLQAIYQIVVLLTLDFAGNSILKLAPNDGPTDRSLLKDDELPRDVLRTTIIFNAFVFCQVRFHFFLFWILIYSFLCQTTLMGVVSVTQ